MESAFDRQGSTLIVAFKGNLLGERDGYPLLEAVSEYLNEGVRHVILDMGELNLINSVGIGTLITVLTRVRKQGGDVYMARMSSFISNIFAIAKLNQLFRIYDNVEAAKLALADSSHP